MSNSVQVKLCFKFCVFTFSGDTVYYLLLSTMCTSNPTSYALNNPKCFLIESVESLRFYNFQCLP